MKKPLVSIVICCHNRAHLLPQTMASVFAQTYKPVEIIVLDDGSTDGTPDLMKTYGERVRYFRQENQGIAVARTNGCLYATGDFIAFQDDDDLMPPDRITVLYEALCEFPTAVFSVGDWAVIDSEGKPTGGRWLPEGSLSNDRPIMLHDGYEAVLWPRVPAVPHTTLFRKKNGQRIGWFDKRFQNASEDKDFFARLGRLGPIVYVPKVVSYYRPGDGSLTNNKVSVAYNQILLFEKHLNCLEHKQKVLRKRLQFRILASLKIVLLWKSKGMEIPTTILDDGLSRGLSLLGFRGRLAYRWVSLIKYPMRRLILGHN